MATQTIRRTVRPDYCSVSDAAKLLGVGQSTVRRWVTTGRLEAKRDPGGGVRIPMYALVLHDIKEDRGVAHRHRR